MRALIASGERVVLIVEPTTYEHQPILPLATGSLVKRPRSAGRMMSYGWGAESDGPQTPEALHAEVLREMHANGCVCDVVVHLGPVVYDFVADVAYITPHVHHDRWCPFLRAVIEGPITTGWR